jgi:hypothetical protein
MTTATLEPFRKNFKKGAVLLREGEQDSQIFLPEEGVLDIVIQGRKVNSIDSSVSPDFIGEVGAILGVPRTATVIAATDCVVICLPKIELEAVMKNAPSLGVKLVLSLCRKLHNSTAAFAEFQSVSTAISQSGNTDISLKNYMKGLLYLLEQSCVPASGITAQSARDYFLRTNPWAISHGDKDQVLDTASAEQNQA